MRKQLQFILVFAILVLLGLIAWRMEYIYTYVIEPTARILWLFYRTLRSVDQMTYWILLVFVVLLLIIRLLPEIAEYSIKPAHTSVDQKNDRVKYWETLIKAAEGDPYDRLRLQSSLQTLSQSIEDHYFRNDQGVILLPNGFSRMASNNELFISITPVPPT